MTNRSVLPENVRKEIFINAGEIYSLHFDLLRELEVQLEQWYVCMIFFCVCIHPSHYSKLLCYCFLFEGTQTQLSLMSLLSEHVSLRQVLNGQVADLL